MNLCKFKPLRYDQSLLVILGQKCLIIAKTRSELNASFKIQQRRKTALFWKNWLGKQFFFQRRSMCQFNTWWIKVFQWPWNKAWREPCKIYRSCKSLSWENKVNFHNIFAIYWQLYHDLSSVSSKRVQWNYNPCRSRKRIGNKFDWVIVN